MSEHGDAFCWRVTVAANGRTFYPVVVDRTAYLAGRRAVIALRYPDGIVVKVDRIHRSGRGNQHGVDQ